MFKTEKEEKTSQLPAQNEYDGAGRGRSEMIKKNLPGKNGGQKQNTTPKNDS